MIWFDYLALGFIAYFVIKGLLSGFIRNLFSLVGMLVAFLYSGWLALKIKPYLAHFIHHPKGQILLSFLLAFGLIYVTFVLLGFMVVLLMKTLHISLGDRILGALFGLIKGALFTTFLYFLIIIPFPPARESLDRSLTYPVVSTTTKVLGRFIPQSWLEFIKRSRKYYEIPKMLLD
jgi:membrane protein required for colicin V production